jgi:hypothetical protein
MCVIFETRITSIYHHQQLIHRDGALRHAFLRVAREYNGSLETNTEHRMTLAMLLQTVK